MTAAVIVIDMINDFVWGKFGFPGARGIMPRISSLLSAARKRGLPVVYVCDSHERDDPELRVWGRHAMAGSEGSKVVRELTPGAGDVVLTKRTYDAFFETPLDEVLRGKGVRNVVLVGVVTDICIQNTAAGAFFRGYSTVVPEDCVASPDDERNIRSLEYMRNIYGARVVRSEELISEWSGP
ncbi:MAG: isochorismatase family cysteine hydrolase [Candidatus Hadarchaeales archaeon]